ncbi:MAG: biopolymer transporter ExbD, partial [Planctomycetota bacterium]|nr:biopolymer transporter ExbD [Planctomycetota bacterium]
MDMTPMIDVTFLLLIFFMCTLKFKVLEGKLTAYLPKDVGV